MAVTSEMLVDFIQQGDIDLKPVLWERVKKLLYFRATGYYIRYPDYCAQYGVDEWDLKQAAFDAFENSFKGYSPEKGAYSTYIILMFRSAVSVLFRSRDPLNESDSLDRPIDTEDNEFTLGDTIADESASEGFEKIDDESVSDVVRAAVDELPEKEQQVIKGSFFNGYTLQKIADESGISAERIRQIKAAALKRLKRNRHIIRLGDELGYTSSQAYNNSLSSFNRYGMSGVESIAIKRADESAKLDAELAEAAERFGCTQELLCSETFRKYLREKSKKNAFTNAETELPHVIVSKFPSVSRLLKR